MPIGMPEVKVLNLSSNELKGNYEKIPVKLTGIFIPHIQYLVIC